MGPAPSEVTTDWILHSGGRPLFVFAHQDDETVLAGMIRRIVTHTDDATFVWWTNGDGLAPMAGASPAAYARTRIQEAAESIRCLGARVDRKVDLESSEIENYRQLSLVPKRGRLGEKALQYFEKQALDVEKAIRAADPDRVFLLAWQGGHPEHDLTHLMTVRALRKLRRETGRAIPIVHCPAYEYKIACSLRFKPWFSGDRRAITLDQDELEAKKASILSHTSQKPVIDAFERVIGVVSFASRFFPGKRVDLDSYLSREEFGVVDPALDYSLSTHRLEACNYMFDDFEGTKIRFSTMVRRVGQMLLEA